MDVGASHGSSLLRHTHDDDERDEEDDWDEKVVMSLISLMFGRTVMPSRRRRGAASTLLCETGIGGALETGRSEVPQVLLRSLVRLLPGLMSCCVALGRRIEGTVIAPRGQWRSKIRFQRVAVLMQWGVHQVPAEQPERGRVAASFEVGEERRRID